MEYETYLILKGANRSYEFKDLSKKGLKKKLSCFMMSCIKLF